MSGVEEREREFFDRHYAEGTWNPSGFELRLAREVKALRRLAGGRRLGRVLSIGCGEGPFECRLAPYADSVLGIDLSAEAITRAQQRAAEQGLTNLEFRCQASSELRLDESFDGVVCLAFLHHVPEAELPGLLRGLLAHLRPGGFFFARDPSRRGLLRALGRLVLGARYHRYHSPDERELDPAEIARQLDAAGITAVEIGWNDLALIPGHYQFPRAGAWLMQLFAGLDRVFCATPLARYASGFTAFARRRPESPA
jgi:2-polyprenyl-3-methyl-5-hydroxy-6-metoxy-1,4-benzoquinol methylase